MHRTVTRRPPPASPLALGDLDLDEAARRVLRLPGVADKTFLITIGDRTVGGLSVRDQMVGPWQVPVSDCAVTASGYWDYTGEAMAMGERAPLAVIDAPASGRMAVAEAISYRRCDHDILTKCRHASATVRAGTRSADGSLSSR